MILPLSRIHRSSSVYIERLSILIVSRFMRYGYFSFCRIDTVAVGIMLLIAVTKGVP